MFYIGQRKHLVPPIVETTRENTEENIGGVVTVLLPETARDSGISCGTRVDDQEKAMYIHYKLAKNVYRRACRSAMNNVISQPFKHLDNYYGSRKMNKFWNLVRRSKGTTSTTTYNISILHYMTTTQTSSLRVPTAIRLFNKLSQKLTPTISIMRTMCIKTSI